MEGDLQVEDQSSNHQQYQKQFFGFSTPEMLVGVTNAGKFYSEEMRKSVKEQLINKGMSSEDAKQFCQDLYQELTNNLSKNATALMQYLPANVFHIPDDILLPEDEVQINQYTEQEEEKLDHEIDLVCQEIRKLQYMKAKAHQESQRLSETTQTKVKKITSEIRRMEELIKQIDNDAAKVNSLKEEVVHQLKGLNQDKIQ
ncbi:hypothetical protein TrispH2_001724 [Trichoplax sp. H2]|nr:hypothetical protein TrispH2_001724 [Trichoplax sp. H2]|eukprot:RDD46132.1 hypothetical protein TrispH2_001724 [Trichoplax sp. H2]